MSKCHIGSRICSLERLTEGQITQVWTKSHFSPHLSSQASSQTSQAHNGKAIKSFHSSSQKCQHLSFCYFGSPETHREWSATIQNPGASRDFQAGCLENVRQNESSYVKEPSHHSPLYPTHTRTHSHKVLAAAANHSVINI